jgi:hypothetical protein
MQTSEWISDQEENEWSFGQLIPIFTIGLGIYTVLEVINGELVRQCYCFGF